MGKCNNREIWVDSDKIGRFLNTLDQSKFTYNLVVEGAMTKIEVEELN